MKFWIAFVSALLLATLTNAQSSGYKVRPGDTLRVEVLEDPTLTRNVIVLPDGRFSFPFAGTVRAGGRTLDQVESTVTRAIASNFATEPNVFVSVLSLRPKDPQTPLAALPPAEAPTISIYFLGEFNSPGERSLAPGTQLLQALAQSGGMTNFAATKRLQLRRTNAHGAQKLYLINYKALEAGAQSRRIVLQDGDVIVAPERRLFE